MDGNRRTIFRGEIETKLEKKRRDITKTKRFVRDYCVYLYAIKLNILEEIDAFLEIYNLPTLNLEEIRSLNRSIIKKGIEAVVNNFPKEKPGTRWLHW